MKCMFGIVIRTIVAFKVNLTCSKNSKIDKLHFHIAFCNTRNLLLKSRFHKISARVHNLQKLMKQLIHKMNFERNKIMKVKIFSLLLTQISMLSRQKHDLSTSHCFAEYEILKQLKYLLIVP